MKKECYTVRKMRERREAEDRALKAKKARLVKREGSNVKK